MKYVKIAELVDGSFREIARIYEDNTFQGTAEYIKDRLENYPLTDPETGEEVVEGEAWLNAIARSYSNMLTAAAVFDEEKEVD